MHGHTSLYRSQAGSAAGKGTGSLSIREVAAQAMIDTGLITKWLAGTYTGPNGAQCRTDVRLATVWRAGLWPAMLPDPLDAELLRTISQRWGAAPEPATSWVPPRVSLCPRPAQWKGE